MQSVHDTCAAVTSYVVAAFTIFYASALENYSGIAAFLGFVLLIARLVQEIPRAYRVIYPKKEIHDT